MKAVSYTRVSTEDQSNNGVSLAAQEERIRQYCALYEIEIVETVTDAGLSAKSLKRPGMQRILEMIRRREVEAVVVAKLDRLTRSVRDLADLVDLTAKRGVSLVSVAEHLDTGSAAGRMVVNMLGVVSQWEREAIGERTATALRYLRSKGEQYNREAPYGFRHVEGAIVRDVTESAVVGLVMQLHGMKKGYTYIAQYLNDNGHTSRSGGKWFAQQVKRVVEGVGVREGIGATATA